MTGLTFGSAPPPDSRKRNGSKWADRLAPLRDRPGEWAELPDEWVGASAYTTAHHIREGHPKGIEPGEFDAAARKVDGTVRMWVRYVVEGEK